MYFSCHSSFSAFCPHSLNGNTSRTGRRKKNMGSHLFVAFSFRYFNNLNNIFVPIYSMRTMKENRKKQEQTKYIIQWIVNLWQLNYLDSSSWEREIPLNHWVILKKNLVDGNIFRQQTNDCIYLCSIHTFELIYGVCIYIHICLCVCSRSLSLTLNCDHTFEGWVGWWIAAMIKARQRDSFCATFRGLFTPWCWCVLS